MVKETKKKIKTVQKKSVARKKKSKRREVVKSKKEKKTDEADKIKKENKKGSKKAVGKKRRESKKKEDKYLAEWTAPEFVRTKEEIFWYYLSVGAAVLMILWSLYQGNLIVVITFALLIVVVIFQLNHQPENVEYKIDLDGIIMDGKIYRYDDLKSFEVIENDNFAVLKFRIKNAILPVKEIQLGNQDPRYIRAALEYFLPEEEQKETLVGYEKKNNFDEEEYLSDEEFYEYIKKEGE